MHPIALYYPYVHLRDERWLKYAALYWPRLARLRVGDYQPDDSPTARALAQDLDWLLEVDPRRAAVAVATPFLQLLNDHGPALRRRFTVTEQDRWAVPLDLPRARRSSGDLPPGADLMGHYKPAPDLVEAAIDAGLARWVEHAGAKWVRMHPELTAVYLTALTEQVATEERLHPITDQPSAHAALSGWTVPKLAEVLLGEQFAEPSRSGALERFVLTAFETIVPADLDRVPIEKIIEVRKRFGDELDAFRDYVTQQVAGLADLTEVRDVEVYRAYLEDEVRTKVTRELDRLKGELRSVGVESAKALVNIKSPLALPSGLAAAATWAGVPPEATVPAALATAVVAVPAQARSRRRQLVAGSPVGYLLRVEQQLDTGGLLRRVSRALVPR